MVEIKGKNIFSASDKITNYISLAIFLSFLEDSGKNILLVTKDQSTNKLPKNSGNIIEYHDEKIEEVISRNLFRVDVLFVFCLHTDVQINYEKIRKVTNIPICFYLLNEVEPDILKITYRNFDKIYLFDKSDKSHLVNDVNEYFTITDIKNNGNPITYKNLKKSFIRNEKIDNIFGKNK